MGLTKEGVCLVQAPDFLAFVFNNADPPGQGVPWDEGNKPSSPRFVESPMDA